MKFDTRTIGEVTERLIDYRGKTPPKVNSGVKLITAKIIKDGFIQNSNFEYISEETYETWMRRGLPKKGDILITTEAPLGEVAQVRTPEKIALAQRIILLRGNPQVIDQQYYFQVLKSPFVQAGLQMRGTGTTVLGIRQNELRQVEIPYYSLPTQRKIAAILSNYDDLIENNTRRIKILEEMAGTIYREWFVEFRFPGHENVKMMESELGLIPEGWEVKRFGEVSLNFDRLRKPLSGQVRSAIQGEYPYYGAASILDHVNDYLFDGRYLLIGEDGSVITKDGRPVLQLVTGKFWANNHTHVVLGKSPISTNFLYLLMTNVAISGYITGTAQPKINQENLNRIPVVSPPRDLLERFDQIVNPICDDIVILDRKNINLRKTRDLLLPKLISGELDVSELDINTDGTQPRKGGTHIPYPLTNRLHSDEKILNGKPVIKGTRLAVEFIIDLLEHDWSNEDILENYPNIVREDIEACRVYQEKVVNASVSG